MVRLVIDYCEIERDFNLGLEGFDLKINCLSSLLEIIFFVCKE